MNTNEAKWPKILIPIVIAIVSTMITCVISYFYGNSFRTIFMIFMLALLCFGCSAFAFIFEQNHKEFNFEHGEHPLRFLVFFVISFCCGLIYPLLPPTGWVFPVLALAMSLFSDQAVGMSAYIGILCITFTISEQDIYLFTVYLITGIFITVVFRHLHNEDRMSIPVIYSTIVYSVLLIGYTIFSSNGQLTYEQIFVPIFNIAVSVMVILALLRIYCLQIMEKEKGEYIDINDQEFELLSKYKTLDEALYFNAIHTTYFCEKIARARHMDVDLAKNGGYYHKIIANECNHSKKTIEDICKEYKFPKKATMLLQEINYKSKNITMKEAAVVYLCDAVITSILYLMAKPENANQDIDYGKIAVGVLERRLDNGALNTSELSLSDISEMKNIFMGEKLYYDFLRRE